MSQQNITQSVAEIIARVRDQGDQALIEFTERWDGVVLTPESLRVPPSVIEGADLSSDFAAAFKRACERIRRFHNQVTPRSISVEDDEGNRLGLRWTPILSVGLYIPGGKAAYPSTLAMTAVPAQIAGVDRIVVVSPPGVDGEVSPQVLMAARLLGIEEIYRVGGAHAIAALALGTRQIPKVDKIFGPGNAFVAEAKKQLYGEVGIDMLAGPSEVVVYADDSAEPSWVAADLMAQAEHDEATRCTLLASEAAVLEAVQRAIAARLDLEPRAHVIQTAFEANGRFEVVQSAEEAAARINEIAPEHLSLQIRDPSGFLGRVRNAGAIFLGGSSPVAVGDYYAGPNHVLPTGRTARFASCLSVEDFMKRSNVCQTSAEFLRLRGVDVEVLAEGEGLPAHKNSIALRRAATDYGPRKGLAAVEAYHLVEEEGDVKLNQNESPFDVPNEIKEEIFARLRDVPWNRYHQKLPEMLRAEIARANTVDPSAVILGNGSNLILQWIFEVFGGPGRTALIPAPSFSLFRMWGRISETSLEEFRLRPGDATLEYPVEPILAAIQEKRPALTVLNLPNNPTGSEIGKDALESILAASASIGGWVVIDEAYQEFSDIGYDRADLVRNGRRVFLLRTFSKALSAAGLRIGYLIAPEAVADEMKKIVPPFHMSIFNAVAGLVLLENADLFRQRVETLKKERRRVMEALGRIPGIKVYSSSANFFLIRVRDAQELHSRLAARGVLVRRLPPDPLLEDCLRINVGTEAENDRLLKEIAGVLE